ncbi:hypothetical protein CY35_13G039800 [Sphagnum magellanicum]|jgi:ribonuclease I|nr:hypothetical protein CY35_13G039800 [Sphagnum magellanicum]KAH9543013.1 hypothetical protein CY35_13G039800 [Sphagnum magellanicum]
MASKLLIPLLLATICGLTVVTASESGNFKDSRLISMPTATREKHILVLVAQWGYSYCCPKKQAECCLPPYLAADFIVHTLWTVKSKREIEKSCNGPVFEKEEIPSDLLGYNKVYWPSLNCSYNDFAYWKLLWERYGWCSGLTQREWFKLAIEIFDPINFIVGLFEKEIVPGGGYTQKQFKEALKIAVGHEVGLLCNTNSATGQRQLYQVLVCYDPDNKEVIDCDSDSLPGPGVGECFNLPGRGEVVLPRNPCKPSSEPACGSDA